MKKALFYLLIFIITFLVACNNKDEQSNQENKEDLSLTPVKVEILVNEQVKLGEVKLQAQVTHNGEPVKEAEEVKFEIWKKGEENKSEKIDGTYTKEGIYEVNVTFEETGTYEMFTHVTAKSQHVMPKLEFEVVE